jgi:hypothetical protein
MAKRKTQDTGVIDINPIEMTQLGLWVVGTTPFICNRQSEKVKRELLMPKGRKTAADKAQSLKHDPLEEYRASPYILPNEDAPTLLAALATSFKKSMMSAALDVPGAKKAQIGRLLRVEGERLPLYGNPHLFMSTTRSADIAKTPDVRTRGIVTPWAVPLTITFPRAAIKEKAVVNLLAAAGMFAGVGDWRTEKGSGNYGSFRVANQQDKELKQIVKDGGRKVQVAAMADAPCYDDETANLLTWFQQELVERGFTLAKTA